MRAPASRHSRMMLVVPVPVEDDRGDVAHPLAERLGHRVQVRLHRRVEVDGVGRGGPGRDLLHVDARAGVEHRAPLRHRDHRDRVVAAERRERGALERVDRDVHERGSAVADLLAVVQHRGFVLLALADHDDAVHRDRVEDEPHRVRRRAVGRVLVAAAHPPSAGERGRLGGADQLHRQVAVGALLRLHRANLPNRASAARPRSEGSYDRSRSADVRRRWFSYPDAWAIATAVPSTCAAVFLRRRGCVRISRRSARARGPAPERTGARGVREAVRLPGRSRARRRAQRRAAAARTGR